MTDDLESFCRDVRRSILKMAHAGKSSHIGSSLSAVEILGTLYGRVMNIDARNPDDPKRDRFIMSKGHAAAVLYATLAHKGYFPMEWLDDYLHNGSQLAGHVTRKGVPGIEVSTGSLGHGLPIGSGFALAAKRSGLGHRIFVVLSDGECDEGSVWESAMFAAHHKLDNLTAVIDYNKIQSFGRVDETMGLEPLADKWTAFGWHAVEVDGHDPNALEAALSQHGPGLPVMVIAHTTKGRGVSFMEDRLEWHYRSLSDDLLEQALKEVD